MKHFIASLLAGLLLSSASLGDTVVERGGREWDGTVTADNDTSVVIRTDDGLEIRLPRDRVARVDYSEASAADAPRRVERSGRVELALFGTGYGVTNGLFLTGLVDGGEDMSAVSMLVGGAAGFAVPWIWSRDHDVSEARATLIGFSGSWGMWQGMGWPFVFGDDVSTNGVLIPGMIGGAAGILASGIVSSGRNLSQGDVELVTSLPGWTSVYWLWIAVLSGADDGRFILGSTLAAGNVGILAGAALASRVEYSRGDVRLINTGGLLGALTGGAAIALANVDDGKTALSVVMIGSLVGTAVAWKLVSPGDNSGDRAQTIRAALAPTVVRSPSNARRFMPGFGLNVRFR